MADKYIKFEEAELACLKNFANGDTLKAIRSLPTYEASEDCISRAEVLKLCTPRKVGETRTAEIGKYLHATEIATGVKGLPSVVANRPKGEWIGTEYDGYADGNPVYYEWECSKCGCVINIDEPTWSFCPNCGARMTDTSTVDLRKETLKEEDWEW